MSDSTPKVDSLTSAQGGKETTANEIWFGMSIAAAFGRRAATTGLTWHFTGPDRMYVNAAAVAGANGSVVLTASSTRYIAADRAMAVTENATAFPADKLALYKAATGTSSVSSYEDHRDFHHINRFLYGRTTIATGNANVTLTYEQAMCESLEFTGALTALRDMIVPTVPRAYTIFANVTGGFGVRVKTSAGSGITVADGKRAIVECDGTNVVRITADV
ncbi:MAG: hypothetical protein LC118_15685 [Dehalococcoidia bacterium]|nr:hypothetical protein [Dehalococcoidia bacterium]